MWGNRRQGAGRSRQGRRIPFEIRAQGAASEVHITMPVRCRKEDHPRPVLIEGRPAEEAEDPVSHAADEALEVAGAFIPIDQTAR
jgi:hypothetical protein